MNKEDASHNDNNTINNGITPTAERIDKFSRTKVIYRCSVCGTSFATLGNKVKYCYHCGMKIDWTNVLIRLHKSLLDYRRQESPSKDLYEFEQEFIQRLNEKQKGEE